MQRIRRRYAAELALLPPGVPDVPRITALVQQLAAGGAPLPSALRVARQLVLERLAVLDTEQNAPLEHITGAMTAWPRPRLSWRWRRPRRQDAINGQPRDANGLVIDFWIIGMGKLGARELNVSSDIDLIYVYEDDGQTDGARPVSAHEYFAAVAKRLHALIGDTTEDGLSSASTWRCAPTATRARGWSAWGAGGVFPGAGPRVGALCLAQEPRHRAARSARSGRALRAGPLVTLRVPPLPRLRVFEGCAAARQIREEAQRAPPAGPSAPTT